MPVLPVPDPPLTDDVVALRLWQTADLDQRLAGYADPEFERFTWSTGEPVTEARLREHVEQEERERARGEKLSLAIVDAAALDQVWGGCSVYDINLDQRRAGVGYWLAPQARGRGAATRTVRLLSQWAFDVLGIARLELTCAPDNFASQRVAARSGFFLEGIMRSYMRFQGGRRDTMLFSLLPGDLRDADRPDRQPTE
ncbi:GNAT family N-acetyltransferase [Nocardia sp. NPDC051321]|uniref:GNAT family N-acetyltransferase n=1 Tax=Nocardia sp. NPDC051321 TaxID=3364323 RepID=UPI0037970DEA